VVRKKERVEQRKKRVRREVVCLEDKGEV